MIAKLTPLSPLLLVRDADAGRLIIANGYQRLCVEVPCRGHRP